MVKTYNIDVKDNILPVLVIKNIYENIETDDNEYSCVGNTLGDGIFNVSFKDDVIRFYEDKESSNTFWVKYDRKDIYFLIHKETFNYIEKLMKDCCASKCNFIYF